MKGRNRHRNVPKKLFTKILKKVLQNKQMFAKIETIIN